MVTVFQLVVTCYVHDLVRMYIACIAYTCGGPTIYRQEYILCTLHIECSISPIYPLLLFQV